MAFSCNKEENYSIHGEILGEWIHVDRSGGSTEPNCDHVRISTNSINTPQLICERPPNGSPVCECDWQHLDSKVYYFTFTGNPNRVNRIMLAGNEEHIWFVGDTLKIGNYPTDGLDWKPDKYLRP